MIGTIIWNFLVGGLSGVLTILFAVMNNNELLTALIRGIISFIVMFVVTFLFRWLLALILLDDERSKTGTEEQQVGHHVDYTTPQQNDLLPEMADTKPESLQATEGSNDEQLDGNNEQSPASTNFQEFQPPRLERVDKDAANKPDPEVTAQAIRRLTEN